MGHDIMRGKQFLALTLILFMALSLAACGQNFNTTPSKQNSPASNRLVEIGATPESGIDERPVVYPNGHLESLMSSSGILYVGSDNGTLYAFRASDGTLLWQDEIGGLVSIYAVTSGAVYAVAGSNYDVVYAFNASSGTPLWHHQIDSSIFGVVVVNSIQWVNQLRTLVGVVKVENPFTATC